MCLICTCISISARREDQVSRKVFIPGAFMPGIGGTSTHTGVYLILSLFSFPIALPLFSASPGRAPQHELFTRFRFLPFKKLLPPIIGKCSPSQVQGYQSFHPAHQRRTPVTHVRTHAGTVPSIFFFSSHIKRRYISGFQKKTNPRIIYSFFLIQTSFIFKIRPNISGTFLSLFLFSYFQRLETGTKPFLPGRIF